MSLISQSFIEDLLSRVDIIDIIGTRIPLRKSGRNYMACCPFHQEKTASFSVVPDKQFYNCFGCGSAGSALKFVMLFDNLEFVPAVEKLAATVGMVISSNNTEQNTGRYQQYYDTLDKISSHYQANLKNHVQALNYIKKRGLDLAVSNYFSLGYALDGWDNLSKIIAATDNNHERLLEEVGLWIKKDDTNKYGYDRFRNRLMFPIRDLKGRVIAFGGRVLDDTKPKYLNSPETPLFHKSAELYGLYEALQFNKQNKTVINKFVIVEGYLDVISLFQHGITYAVATLGTATSYRHLAKLFKYCDEVIYCFDGDTAGRTAAWRALENSLASLYDGRKIKFLFLPSEHDPDSYVRAAGKYDFEQKLEEATSITDYLFLHQEELLGTDGLMTVEGRVNFVKLCKPLINRVPEGAYRIILETELAKRCQLTQDKINKLINQDPGSNSHTAVSDNGSNELANPHRQDNEYADNKYRPALWQQASLLLVHNTGFIELLSQELVDLISNCQTNFKSHKFVQGSFIFTNIFRGLKQIKTIPEFIDKLMEKEDNIGANLKNIIVNLLAKDPIVNGEMAKEEFKDLLLKIAKEMNQLETDILKAKVSKSGMSSLTADEKKKLLILLEN